MRIDAIALSIALTVVGQFLPLSSHAAQSCADLYPHAFNEDLANLSFRTQRLQIKALEFGNLQEAVSVWTDPQTMQMSGDFMNEMMVSQLLLMGKTKFARVKDSMNPFINFGIYMNGEIVGVSQIAVGQENSIYDTGKGNGNEKWISISYLLKPAAWGKGIATEAAIRLTQFAFENLNVAGIHAEAITSNIGSQNILKKLGFKKLEYRDPDHVHFYMNKATYLHLENKP